MRRRLPLLVLLVATLVVGAVAPAMAHQRPEADALPAVSPVAVPPLIETLTSRAPGPAPPWAVIAVAAVVTLAVAWRPRRSLAVALVLVAGILAFETGVHSAHHLGQADEAARCAVAGMATQLNADLVDVTPDAVPITVSGSGIVALASPVVTARLVAPDAGRAPPALSA
jgi:hypothetical protein